MKKSKFVTIFLLFVLLCGFFAGCNNPIMEKWWDDSPSKTPDPEPDPVEDLAFFFVRFDSRGGIPEPGYQLVASGALIAKLPQITNDELGFGGWFRDEDFVSEWDFAYETVHSDLVLYAKWISPAPHPIYKVTFEENYIFTNGVPDGAPVLEDIFVTEEMIIPVPPPLSRTNVFGGQYGFGGWFIDKACIEEWHFDIDTVSDNTILYAKWDELHCIVTFESNFETLIESQDLIEGAKVIEPHISRTGYGFGGWFTDVGLTTQWNFADDRITQSMTSLTLYAKWEPITYYTVTFVANGGTPVPEPQRVESGKIAKVPAMTKSGDGFSGWFRNASFTGNPWNFATDVVTANITLYAKWFETPPPPPVYRVAFNENYTYDANGRPDGNPVLNDLYIVSGSKIPTPTSLRRSNTDGIWYGFGGWFSDKALTREWHFNTDTVRDNMTLYAKWDVQHCIVRFEANGGSPVPRTQDLLSGSKIIEPLAMNRSGYGFDGWYTNTALTNKWDFINNRIGSETSLTLYAKWVLRSYTVTFNAMSGTPVPAAQTINFGEKVSQPEPMSRPGFGFGGWFADEAFTKEWLFEVNTVSDNTTLYAFWDSSHVTVVFNTSYSGGQGLPVPAAQSVTPGGRLVEPPYPSRTDGYSFAGWYPTTGISEEWDFDDPVNVDMTLRARWVPNIPGMTWIPSGSFIMGDDNVSGAKPAHRIKVSGFYISRYPVTQQEYIALMGTNPSNFTRTVGGGPTNAPTAPVDGVDWYDAVAYCIELSRAWTGSWVGPGPAPEALNHVYNSAIKHVPPIAVWNNNGYRLPTEAEWEYAARGGNGSPGDFIYSGSDDPNAVAWYNTNTSTAAGGLGTGTQLVGRKAANSLGLYDMSGNINEWCWDWFDSNYYKTSPLKNPIGPVLGTERVRRGGSWNNAYTNIRSVARNSWNPAGLTGSNPYWTLGFRVVRGPTVPPNIY